MSSGGSQDPIDNTGSDVGEFDVGVGSSDRIDYKYEYDDAKLFLQKVSPFTGENLYAILNTTNLFFYNAIYYNKYVFVDMII